MKLPSKDQLMSLYRKKRMVESISLDELIANRSKDNPHLHIERGCHHTMVHDRSIE